MCAIACLNQERFVWTCQATNEANYNCCHDTMDDPQINSPCSLFKLCIYAEMIDGIQNHRDDLYCVELAGAWCPHRSRYKLTLWNKLCTIELLLLHNVNQTWDHLISLFLLSHGSHGTNNGFFPQVVGHFLLASHQDNLDQPDPSISCMPLLHACPASQQHLCLSLTLLFGFYMLLDAKWAG